MSAWFFPRFYGFLSVRIMDVYVFFVLTVFTTLGVYIIYRFFLLAVRYVFVSIGTNRRYYLLILLCW